MTETKSNEVHKIYHPEQTHADTRVPDMTDAEVKKFMNNSKVDLYSPETYLENRAKGELSCSCVDGREEIGDTHDEPRVGAPGGGIGELLIVATETKKQLGSAFDEEVFFSNYLDEHSCYMHTDDHAISNLNKNVPELKDLTPDMLQNPPEELKDILLEKLTDPEFIGCGHLKLILKKKTGDLYKMNQDLVQTYIRIFYQKLWSEKSRAHLAVLTGSHKESAVIQVNVKKIGESNAPVPIASFSHHVDGKDAFVYNMAAAKLIRTEIWDTIYEFINKKGNNIIPDNSRPEILGNCEKLAETQLLVTLKELAANRPMYEIDIEVDSEQKGDNIAYKEIRRSAKSIGKI